MQIKKKVISNIRIREDRAEKLREKSFELSMKAKFLITESDIVNYLIDNYADDVIFEKEELKITKR